MKQQPYLNLDFFTTPAHPCSYLPPQQATMCIVDPKQASNLITYTTLCANGFRRNGDTIYRPHCDRCSACIPLRIPVGDFMPRRRHRRTLKRNIGLEVQPLPAGYNSLHYDLYCRYQRARHPNGGMDKATPDDYRSFLCSSWCDTVFYEFQRDGSLVAVVVVDHLIDALSAVYSFYDPTLPHLNLGSYLVLWLIATAQQLKLDWLYLGYWIQQSKKMRYKSEYRPQQRLIDNRWVTVGYLEKPQRDGGLGEGI